MWGREQERWSSVESHREAKETDPGGMVRDLGANLAPT